MQTLTCSKPRNPAVASHTLPLKTTTTIIITPLKKTRTTSKETEKKVENRIFKNQIGFIFCLRNEKCEPEMWFEQDR